MQASTSALHQVQHACTLTLTSSAHVQVSYKGTVLCFSSAVLVRLLVRCAQAYFTPVVGSKVEGKYGARARGKIYTCGAGGKPPSKYSVPNSVEDCTEGQQQGTGLHPCTETCDRALLLAKIVLGFVLFHSCKTCKDLKKP